jgi:hypothetical protein
MRIHLLTATLALLVTAVIASADEGKGDKTPSKAPFVHPVIFYLKKDTPAAKREALIADCHKMLAKIPSVRGLWAGEPAAKSTPEAVKDFQVGLLVLFDNAEGLKAYLEHPDHLKFVEIYLPLIEKIQVYDFVDKAK